MSLPHTHRPISTNIKTLSYNTRTESHRQYIIRHLNRLWNGPVGLTELIKYLVLCTFSGILSMRASCLLAEYGKPLSWWPPHWTLEILFMTVTSVGGVAGIYILLKLARRVVDPILAVPGVILLAISLIVFLVARVLEILVPIVLLTAKWLASISGLSGLWWIEGMMETEYVEEMDGQSQVPGFFRLSPMERWITGTGNSPTFMPVQPMLRAYTVGLLEMFGVRSLRLWGDVKELFGGRRGGEIRLEKF